METPVEFDLDEFLAYLLPGALLIVLGHAVFGVQAVKYLLDLKLPEPNYTTAFLSLFSYLAISLTFGHVASLWNRYVIQPIMQRIAGDPQSAIFGDIDQGFYSQHFRTLISERFARLYGADLYAPAMREAAPHMIRAHVMRTCPAAVSARDKVVRARSLCGNLTLPMILFGVQLLSKSAWLVAPVPILVAALLAQKQHILDRREYRTISTFFIED